MQINCEDFSLLEYNEGCCLKCGDSSEGCLCFSCKCKKCSWYISPEDWNGEKGKCGLIIERRKNFKVIPFASSLKNRNFDCEKLIIKPNDWLNEKNNGN